MLTHFDNLQYGSHKGLEVLVDLETNEIWVAQASIMRLLGFDNADGVSKRLASKGFKSYVGKGLPSIKTTKAKDILGRPNTIKAVPYDTFLKFVFWQSKQDNPAADALLLGGLADSFSSLILEQCGVHVAVTQRQKIVTYYLSRYHVLFDWIRDEYVKLHGKSPEGWYYAKVNQSFNQRLFDRNDFGYDRIANANDDELHSLDNAQETVMRLIHQGWSGEIKDPAKRVVTIVEKLYLCNK
jgi:hypothetical protein